VQCRKLAPGLIGDIKITSYAPDQPVTIIERVPLPANIKDVPKNIDDLGHPFWRRFVGGGSLDIRCVFHFYESGMQITSDAVPVGIRPRPDKEIAALQELDEYDKRAGDTTIRPGNFGFIGLNGLRTRQQIAGLAGIIKSGELGGILTLTRLVEQLKYDTDIDRDEINKQVLDWIASQPDIKRQWMARRLLSYQSIFSPAVVEKLRATMNEPVRPPEP
jgi:hypothetical protein